ncbi:LexA family protein [Candidatus Magnetaquicoccus inordinatus]|uniref:LexA family protein n=1 Tax=Candidatus Magnetaquicoccus inordinatus TaxID=2496818 RepID=UPI00187D6215|nr:XRE family transcriptional regulator [Candidatus Magnetaquicoccus inordinatus]
MTLSERIQTARKQAKLTQKELADRVGISQTAVHKLECGRSKSSRNTVSIALTCGVDPIWLDSGRGEMSLVGANPGMNQNDINKATEEGEIYRVPIFARLPLISWEDASRLCAEPIESFHPQSVEAWIPIAPRSSDRTFALRVHDDSMEPEFREGDTIIVDPSQPGKHNQFLVARVEGDHMATFKQLIVIGNRTYLKPLNSRYPLLDIQSTIRVCGVVVGKYKEY